MTINAEKQKGFTLIELLIVVAIIGILAAIAITGYIGMQERSKKGSVVRAVGAAEAELQAWLLSAFKGSPLTEVDSDGNGVIDNNDVNNSTLTQDLITANQLCSRYISARWAMKPEISPWYPTAPLWISNSAVTPGRISCAHEANARKLVLTAWDSTSAVIYTKLISSD